MNADGALIVFGEIQNLVDRLERIDVTGIGGVHLINVGRLKPTGAGVIGKSVAVFNAEILDFESADGGGHPAVLIAMIVNAGELADFPTNSHAFEKIVLKDEIASVAALGKIEISVERFRANVILDDEILHIFEREIPGGDSGEIFDPIGDGELGGGEVVGHEVPPRDYNADKCK